MDDKIQMFVCMWGHWHSCRKWAKNALPKLSFSLIFVCFWVECSNFKLVCCIVSRIHSSPSSSSSSLYSCRSPLQISPTQDLRLKPEHTTEPSSSFSTCGDCCFIASLLLFCLILISKQANSSFWWCFSVWCVWVLYVCVCVWFQKTNKLNVHS